MKLPLLILLFLLSFSLCQAQQALNWDTLEGGFSNCVALTLYNDTIDDYLYAGGGFMYAGNTFTSGIARWNGVSWTALDSGLGVGNCAAHVWTITRYNGKIYAGGTFYGAPNPNGLPLRYIASWDGVQWDSVGIRPNMYTSVLELKVFNNELYACGSFDSIGGIRVGYTARYDGTNWYAIHDTLWETGIQDIAVYQGEVYVCGQVGSSGGGRVYKFNGSGWQLVGSGLIGIGSALSLEIYNNELYIGGNFFKSQGNAGNCLQKWNGSQWLDVDDGLDWTVRDMVVRNGKLYVCGDFMLAGGITAKKMAVWDGYKWCGINNTINSTPFAIDVYNNEPYLGGWFTQIDGFPYRYIAHYTGGTDMDSCSQIDSVVLPVLPDEDVHIYFDEVSGNFIVRGSEQSADILVYNSLGQLVIKYINKDITNGQPLALETYPNGIYLYSVIYKDNLLNGKIIIK